MVSTATKPRSRKCARWWLTVLLGSPISAAISAALAGPCSRIRMIFERIGWEIALTKALPDVASRSGSGFSSNVPSPPAGLFPGARDHDRPSLPIVGEDEPRRARFVVATVSAGRAAAPELGREGESAADHRPPQGDLELLRGGGGLGE